MAEVYDIFGGRRRRRNKEEGGRIDVKLLYVFLCVREEVVSR